MPDRGTPYVVVVAAQQDEYGSRIWAGARSVLAPAGVATLVHLQARPSVCLPNSLKQILRFGAPRGVILTALASAEAEKEVTAHIGDLNVPAVAIAYSSFPGPRVLANNATGMRELMRHLVEDCGVRRPVLARGKPGQVDAVEREQVFRAELERHGIPFEEDLVVEGMFWHDVTYHAMRDLLRRRRDMDAVVAGNDLSAFGALQALREAGLRVPEDVRLAGFDNLQMASVTMPAMTSVDQEAEEQGRIAARLLLDLDGQACAAPTVVVPSHAVQRGSTLSTPASGEGLTQMALMMETQAAELGAISSLSRALANARTLEDLFSALTSCLSWGNVDRFFVALHQTDGAHDQDQEHDQPPRTRLVFAYRDGRRMTPPGGDFPASQILPTALQPELADGMLAMQPLEMAGQEIGYMLFDRERGTVTTSEIFQVNISRTIDAVLSAKKLVDYAAGLEDVVRFRTQELEAEVRTRRLAEQQLHRANAELARLAMVDGLTGIANRSAFDQHLSGHWQASVEQDQDFCLVLVDVDHFKAFNDHYGHLGGDHALRIVASCLERAVIGPDDLACRYGGEEFAAILPGSGLAAGASVTERFRRLLAQQAIPHAMSPVAPIVTVSIGVATRIATDRWATDVVEAADKALYQAKSSGRDCVRTADRAPSTQPTSSTGLNAARFAPRVRPPRPSPSAETNTPHR